MRFIKALFTQYRTPGAVRIDVFTLLSAGLLLIMSNQSGAAETDEQPLEFDFINNPPGALISFDYYRLHVDCQGQGKVTVLFEAGLGGNSLEWQPVQTQLIHRARACLYDRAGYAWSDPSPYPRHARQLAAESGLLLRALNVKGPLVLVGHSFGGFVIRELAAQLSTQAETEVVGMVLIDSSHEDQLARLETDGSKTMPTSGNFVISSNDAPENLPTDIRRKIQAFSRMRKTYSATHAEMSLFRASAAQVQSSRAKVDYPVVVLSRGLDPYTRDKRGEEKNSIWHELQLDLSQLSSSGRLIRATKSGHHVHVDEPALVAQTIEGILDDYEER